MSDVTCEPRFVTSASRCSGKSPDVSEPFGPASVNAPPFGLTWLRERLSAPAAKWHVAHAVRPSLPACMSQKSALPSLTALVRSRTKSPSFGGDGTGSVLSGAGSPGPSALAWVPPASRRTSADAATMPDANSPRRMAHGKTSPP